ncbi:hypothetical protein JS756_29700 [Streptomyces actuosus]|uniref:Uncharacterized protein n=1 Tax=Streptomyces actuosus TaxID=1885 RepID=A0ABS2VZ90_STRAS|nr:hypothetical protein [Streptomyces actuosus]MBN0048210.1 hypothetical protein [Streptomyces actuosus]
MSPEILNAPPSRRSLLIPGVAPTDPTAVDEWGSARSFHPAGAWAAVARGY